MSIHTKGDWVIEIEDNLSHKDRVEICHRILKRLKSKDRLALFRKHNIEGRTKKNKALAQEEYIFDWAQRIVINPDRNPELEMEVAEEIVELGEFENLLLRTIRIHRYSSRPFLNCHTFIGASTEGTISLKGTLVQEYTNKKELTSTVEDLDMLEDI